MRVLALDSSRWLELSAHFDNAGKDGALPAVPTLLGRWLDVAGTYGEEYAYDGLRESFLHQGSVVSIAYAVVPHLAAAIDRLDPDRQREVLRDIAEVEEAREMPVEELERRVAALSTLPDELRAQVERQLRATHAPAPPDLAPAYLAALGALASRFGETWRRADDDEVVKNRYPRRHVRHLRASGWTDIDIAWAVQALRATDPDTGESAIYALSAEAGRAFLRDRATSEQRARLRLDDPAGELGHWAVRTLAWPSTLAIEEILR